jgi:hypothetical protein
MWQRGAHRICIALVLPEDMLRRLLALLVVRDITGPVQVSIHVGTSAR